MKGLIIGVICFVLVVAVGLVGFLVIGISGGLPQMSLFNWEANLELANRQVFSASEIDELTVQYSSERITLLPSNGDEIVLEEYMSNWDDEMLATTAQSGNSLSIRAGQRPIRIFSFWRAHINIYVPQQWMGDLKLENSSGSIVCEQDVLVNNFTAASNSGSIKLETVTAKGSIHLKASSGSVKAQQLAADGSVTVSTSSGSIKLGTVQAADIDASASSGSVKFEQARAETITATASSGSIQFEYIEGIFNLQNSSGSIRVEDGIGSGQCQNSSGGVRVTLSELTGNLKMKTTSGNCRLTLPEGTAFNFSGSTTSGSINLPKDGSVGYNQKGNEASGSFGAGAEYLVEMQASSGGVKVEWR